MGLRGEREVWLPQSRPRVEPGHLGSHPGPAPCQLWDLGRSFVHGGPSQAPRTGSGMKSALPRTAVTFPSSPFTHSPGAHESGYTQTPPALISLHSAATPPFFKGECHVEGRIRTLGERAGRRWQAHLALGQPRSLSGPFSPHLWKGTRAFTCTAPSGGAQNRGIGPCLLNRLAFPLSARVRKRGLLSGGCLTTVRPPLLRMGRQLAWRTGVPGASGENLGLRGPVGP